MWMLLAALAAPAGAATFCVNPNGIAGCVKTIGAAVAAAGTYKEAVVIGKPLMLIGADPAKTIIDATGLPNGINVDGLDNPNLSGVMIAGFTVKNAEYEGIVVTNASSVTIVGNILTGNDTGLTVVGGQPACPGIAAWETSEGEDCGEAIHLSGVDHAAILNNTVTGNSGGILLADETGATHDNLIAGNAVVGNTLDCGITLASHPPAASTGATAPFGVYANSVTGNEASQNGLNGAGAGVGLFGPIPGAKMYGNLVVNNVLTGNGLPGIAVHGHTPGQTFNGNVFVGNTLSGNGADTDDAATPGTAGVAFLSVSPVAGTVILQNSFDHEAIGVAWIGAGEARVEGNAFATRFGVDNLGPGTVTADNNWWNCAANPAQPIASLVGCALTGGLVTVNNWQTQPEVASGGVVLAESSAILAGASVGTVVSVTTSPSSCPAGTVAVPIITGAAAGQFDCVVMH